MWINFGGSPNSSRPPLPSLEFRFLWKDSLTVTLILYALLTCIVTLGEESGRRAPTVVLS